MVKATTLQLLDGKREVTISVTGSRDELERELFALSVFANQYIGGTTEFKATYTYTVEPKEVNNARHYH